MLQCIYSNIQYIDQTTSGSQLIDQQVGRDDTSNFASMHACSNEEVGTRSIQSLNRDPGLANQEPGIRFPEK